MVTTPPNSSNRPSSGGLLNSSNRLPRGVFYCKRCKKAFAPTLNGDQPPSYVETTYPPEFGTPPESPHDHVDDDHDHDFPTITTIPFSFTLPPLSVHHPMDSHVAVQLASRDPLTAIRLLRERLRRSFGANVNVNDINVPAPAPVIADNQDVNIEIAVGIPLVPVEDNDHEWIRSKNEKLLGSDDSDDSEESGGDTTPTTTEDGDADGDAEIVEQVVDLTLKL